MFEKTHRAKNGQRLVAGEKLSTEGFPMGEYSDRLLCRFRERRGGYVMGGEERRKEKGGIRGMKRE